MMLKPNQRQIAYSSAMKSSSGRASLRCQWLTQREFTRAGYLCDVAEKSVSMGGKGMIKRDLFGFIDVLAMGRQRIIGIQACAYSGLSSHRRKLATEAYNMAKCWLLNGGLIELHAWRVHKDYVGKRGTIVIEHFPEQIHLATLETLRVKYHHEDED